MRPWHFILLFLLALGGIANSGEPPTGAQVQTTVEQTPDAVIINHSNTSICSGNDVKVSAPGAVVICGRRYP